jgi:hypothetical protein
MSKAKEQLKKREEEKQNRPLDPLLTHGLRRGMRGQIFKFFQQIAYKNSIETTKR